MTDSTPDEGIQQTIEAAQLRAAANQYRLRLRLHQQQLRQIRTGRPQR
jgi:hypothetical protein